jgi:ATPase components of various ABC-type transport systems, contain duplicated ATPase
MAEPAKGAEAPLLELAGIVKRYDRRPSLFGPRRPPTEALKGVSLSVERGETLGLVGESGCGKSTLARIVMRLDEPSAGRILFEGRDITGASGAELRALRKKIQIVFQDPYSSLNPRMRVGDMIDEALRFHGSGDAAWRAKRVEGLLSMVGLSRGSEDRFPHEFSGGQRQRIGIARALSVGPSLLVCDEPVSALDVSIQAQILNLLKDLQSELGLTMLFIAHGLGAVKYVSDRIAVMRAGEIVEMGTTLSIFSDPRHEYTRALLDAYPRPNPRYRITRGSSSPVEGGAYARADRA